MFFINTEDTNPFHRIEHDVRFGERLPEPKVGPLTGPPHSHLHPNRRRDYDGRIRTLKISIDKRPRLRHARFNLAAG